MRSRPSPSAPARSSSRATRPTSRSRPSGTRTTGTSPTRTSTRSSSVPSPTPSTAGTRSKSGAVQIIHTTNGETIADVPRQQGLRARRADLQGRDQLHAAARHPDAAGRVAVAADRSAGPLRARQRLRLPDDHRHDRRRRRPSSPTGRSRPTQVGYLEGHAATRRSRTWPRPRRSSPTTRRSTPARSTSPWPPRRTTTNLTIAQFQKQWWEEAGVDTVTIDQIDQGNYIVTALLGQLPGLPVAQPQRRRPRPAVHLVALLDRAPRRAAGPELRPHQGPGHRPGPRRQPGRDRSGQEAGATPRRSTSASPSSATTSGAAGRPGPSSTTRRSRSRPTITLPDGSTTRPTNEIVDVRDALDPAVARTGSGPSAGRVRGEKPRWGVVDAVSMSPYLAGGRLWRRSQPAKGGSGRARASRRRADRGGTR